MAKDKQTTYQNIRFPLVGTYFHRTDDIEQYLTDGKDQQFVNCYFDQIENPLTGNKTLKVKKRPGWVVNLPFSGVTSNGIFTALIWKNLISEIPRISIWKTGTNSADIFKEQTSIGTLSVTGANSSSAITPALHGSTHSLIFWIRGSGSVRKAYYTDGSTTTEITNAEFPDATMVGNFVFIDGYAFIMTEAGNIYNSDLNSLSSWTNTSFLNSGALPDRGITLARYKDKLVAFNSSSIEFFELNPNPPSVGSVLQRVNHLAILDIGCFDNYSSSAHTDIITYLDTIFWLSGYEEPAKTGLYMLENYQPIKLSTPEIDVIISRGYHLCGAFNFQGNNFIALYCSTNSEFILFHLETKEWTRWKYGFTTGSFAPIVQGSSGDEASITTYGDTNSYIIHTDSSSFVYQDAGSTYTMKIQTSRVDFGTNKRKRLHKLDVIGDKQGTANNLSINWSDDDYANFNTARTVAMGDARPYLNNCGIFRRRAFKLEHSANTACELEALELTFSVMET